MSFLAKIVFFVDVVMLTDLQADTSKPYQLH